SPATGASAGWIRPISARMSYGVPSPPSLMTWARFRLETPQGVRLTVSPLSAADIAPLADAVAAAAGPARPVSYG
ncbi:hypothetical protein AB0B51_19170, partial [Streptomyces griseus]